MGRLFLIDLKGSFYSCKYCRTPLALKEDLLSKSFYSMNGRAYLFYDVVNVTNGQREHRQMVTGWHTVVDIYCVRCGSLLGWEYVTAYEKSQKYKEGNFVLERCKVLDPDGHPYVPSQVVHNGQEPEIGQESEDDEEPEIGQEG